MRAYPDDAYLLSTAGYQKKNAYLIKYWPQIQARQSPQDPLLAEAEDYFWKALQVRPDDPAALNGLGSILWLRDDLDAAEFFVQRALERAQEEGITYSYAEEDLKNIPEAASMGLGCGNPVAMASLHEGETVLDLGSGGGIDVFLAAKRVGPKGKAIGVDMTPAMVTKARELATKYG